jgi:predicted DNA binding CopG/RHH family protein
MVGRRWSRSEMFTLSEMRCAGAKAIGLKLGRSPEAVQSRAERAGIKLAGSREVGVIEVRFQLPEKTHESLRAKAAKHGMGLSPYLRKFLVKADAQNLDDTRSFLARSSPRLTMRQISDFSDRIDSSVIGALRREAAAHDVDLVTYLVELIEARTSRVPVVQQRRRAVGGPRYENAQA